MNCASKSACGAEQSPREQIVNVNDPYVVVFAEELFGWLVVHKLGKDLVALLSSF